MTDGAVKPSQGRRDTDRRMAKCAGPTSFGVYVVDAWGDPVGVGSNGARWCTIGAIAKTNAAGRPFLVANEFICNRLAMMLGLPTPPGVIARSDNGEACFVALRFGRHSEVPPPANLDLTTALTTGQRIC